MGVPIAELFVSVGADVTQAIAGLTALGTQLEGTTAKFQAAAPAALLLEGAAAGIGAGLFGAVKVAASFEQAMADVRAVMTPNEAQQFGSALGDLAVQLGQDTVFSAREASAGIGELIRAGIPAEAVLGGAAAAALNLASATGISVASAATTAAQTMNAFHKTAADLTNVVDVLAGTANATAATMSDLQFGLQVVSATANTMGLSFQDTTTAIGLFVNAGITGATAGTGLRQMLLELIPTTHPAKAEMLALGLVTKEGGNAFFDAAGHVKNLAGIAQVLQNALKGMSDQQRIAALNTLFTRDAINSATILAQQGAAGVNQLTDAIDQISAAETAAIRLGTLTGALNNLGSSFETVQIKIGELFIPTITSIAIGLRGMLDSFSSLDPELQKAIVFFTAIGGATAGLVGSMVLLAPFIAALGPAFAALGGALVGVAPLFLPIIAVAGLLAAAWQVNLGGVQAIVANAFGRLPDTLDFLSGKFQAAALLWSDSVLPAVDKIGSAVGDKLGGVFRTLGAGPLGNFGLVLQRAFSGDFGGAVDTFIAIIGAVVPALGPIIQNVRTVIGGIATGLGPILSNFGLIFQKVFAGDIRGALDTFRAVIGAVSPDLGRFLTAARDLAGVVGPVLGAAFQTVGRFLATEVGPRLVEFASNILPTLQSASTALGVFWETRLGPALQAVGNFIVTEVAPRFQSLVDAAIPALIGASQDLKSFWDTRLGPSLESIGNFIAQNVEPAFITLGNALANVRDSGIVNFFGELGKLLLAPAQIVGGALLTFLQDQLPGALTAIGTQAASLGPFIGSLSNFFGALFNVITALGTVGGTALQGLFSNVLVPGFRELGDVLTPIHPVLTAVSDAITGMSGGFATIGGLIKPVTDFFNGAAEALNRWSDAIRGFPLPELLKPGGGPSAGGPTGVGGGVAGRGSSFQPTAFNPNGGGGGPLMVINQLIISTEAEAEAFLGKVAAVIDASAKRVAQPPDNSGFPQLVTV